MLAERRPVGAEDQLLPSASSGLVPDHACLSFAGTLCPIQLPLFQHLPGYSAGGRTPERLVFPQGTRQTDTPPLVLSSCGMIQSRPSQYQPDRLLKLSRQNP